MAFFRVWKIKQNQDDHRILEQSWSSALIGHVLLDSLFKCVCSPDYSTFVGWFVCPFAYRLVGVCLVLSIWVSVFNVFLVSVCVSCHFFMLVCHCHVIHHFIARLTLTLEINLFLLKSEMTRTRENIQDLSAKVVQMMYLTQVGRPAFSAVPWSKNLQYSSCFDALPSIFVVFHCIYCLCQLYIFFHQNDNVIDDV